MSMAWIGGISALAGAATSIYGASQRPGQLNPAQVGADALEAQIRLAPDQYAAEARYQPLYARLNQGILGQQLFGFDPQQANVWENGPAGLKAEIEAGYKEYYDWATSINRQTGRPNEAAPRPKEQWLSDHIRENPDDDVSRAVQEYAAGNPMSMLDMVKQASPAIQDLANQTTRSQREASLRDVQDLAPGYKQAFDAANPQLAAMQNAMAGDAMGTIGGGMTLQQQLGFSPATLAGAWQPATSGSQSSLPKQATGGPSTPGSGDTFRGGSPVGGGTSSAGSGVAPTFVPMMDRGVAPMQAAQRGAAPFHSAILDQGPTGFQAAQRGSSPYLEGPHVTAAQRGLAPTLEGPHVTAAQRGLAPTLEGPHMDAAQAGRSLLSQDLNTMARRGVLSDGLSSVGRQMQSQALGDLALGGSLSPEQQRLAQQASREAFTARGLGRSQAAGIDEALRVLDASRTLQNERRAFASGVDAQNLQSKQVANQFGLGVDTQNQGLAQFNAGLLQDAAARNQATGLSAGALNVNLAAQQQSENAQLAQQAALANQATGLSAGIQNVNLAAAQQSENAQLAQQAALANQATGLSAGSLNVGLAASQQEADTTRAQEAARLGFQTAADQARYNSMIQNQAGMFNVGLADQQQAQDLANRQQAALVNFGYAGDLSRYNTGLANQGGMYNIDTYLRNREANRAYSGNVANMLTGTSIDPSLAVLGQQSASPQAGMGLVAAGQGFQGGPNIFNPWSSDILGINAANQKNRAAYSAGLVGAGANMFGAGLGAWGAYGG